MGDIRISVDEVSRSSCNSWTCGFDAPDLVMEKQATSGLLFLPGHLPYSSSQWVHVSTFPSVAQRKHFLLD